MGLFVYLFFINLFILMGICKNICSFFLHIALMKHLQKKLICEMLMFSSLSVGKLPTSRDPNFRTILLSRSHQRLASLLGVIFARVMHSLSIALRG